MKDSFFKIQNYADKLIAIILICIESYYLKDFGAIGFISITYLIISLIIKNNNLHYTIFFNYILVVFLTLTNIQYSSIHKLNIIWLIVAVVSKIMALDFMDKYLNNRKR